MAIKIDSKEVSSGMTIKIDSKNHWAFLDEMEAPMWADLDLEKKSSSYKNATDDSWFFSDHLFHSCSSRQLKAAFSYSSKSFGSPVVNSKISCSPKLSSSVSRSRGKEYAIKEWKKQEQKPLLNVKIQVKSVNSFKSSAESEEKNKKVLKLSCKGVNSTSTMHKKNENNGSKNFQQHEANEEKSTSHTSGLSSSTSLRKDSSQTISSSGKSSVRSSSRLLVTSSNSKEKKLDIRSTVKKTETCKIKPKALKEVKVANVDSEVPKRATPLGVVTNANKKLPSLREVRPGKENSFEAAAFVQKDRKSNPPLFRSFQTKKDDRTLLSSAQVPSTKKQFVAQSFQVQRTSNRIELQRRNLIR